MAWRARVRERESEWERSEYSTRVREWHGFSKVGFCTLILLKKTVHLVPVPQISVMEYCMHSLKLIFSGLKRANKIFTISYYINGLWVYET